MKWTSFLFLGLITLAIWSCSVTTASYVPLHKIMAEQKEPESVELLPFKPSRLALCVGLISTSGDCFASQDDAVKEAKKKAAALGADFIVRENSGTETLTHVDPGYSKYQSNGSAYLNGNNRSIYGSASQATSAYSVGPSVSTYNYPWAVFSAWIYRPSRSGIEFDDDYVVTRFLLQSNAEELGVKIGDKVIGMNGLDVKDDKMGQHLMGVQPGDEMVFTILRDGKRMDFKIKALEN